MFISTQGVYSNRAALRALAQARFRAKATLQTGPIYTGFFFKAWDSLAGSRPPAAAPCICSRCEAAAGRRSPQAWAALPKPDYAPLLSPAFWWAGDAAAPAPRSKAA